MFKNVFFLQTQADLTDILDKKLLLSKKQQSKLLHTNHNYYMKDSC